ncbi:hypothetical protein FSP39_003972 [Pinctada imbricata]|uniref:C-type lectin domain-containing protein n=1 Tax=Pinctada imbricata TaxID=66713 RepID=A0AA89C4K1_PINIB|nr:hypothetical protein FSP39_003972 [Pinctada imbricata]
MADTSDPEIKFRDENEAVAENDQAVGDMADEREEDDSEVEIIHPRDHEGRPAFLDRGDVGFDLIVPSSHLALGTCMAFESSLVSIGNSEENSAISVHLSKLHPIDKDRNHSDFWIGGNDIEYEGNFRWISSESDFGFTDWDDGQPDAPKYKQDCVQMQGLKAYKWHDDLCTLHHYFICEQE